MPIADNDPRVFFAAERTLLAWLRTGLNLIAIGFVVSRFGLFLHLMRIQADLATPLQGKVSAVLGVLFALVGALVVAVSARQHQRFVATLASVDLPPAYSRRNAVMLAYGVSLLGLVLAAYLVIAG